MTDFFTEQAIKLVRDSGTRLDANETATLDRVLVQLRSTVYTDTNMPLTGRTLLPNATDIAADADEYAYQVDSLVGEAKVGAHAADDPPRVDVKAREVGGKVYPVTDAFAYSVTDLARAARTGQSLQVRRATAARDAIERGIDKMIALGRTSAPGESNLVTTGIMNNTGIEGAALARVVAFTDWTDASDPDDILAELFELANKPSIDTDGAFVATDLVLPHNRFLIASSMKVGVDSDRTVLDWFKLNSTVKTVTGWARANTLGANTTGRAIAYAKAAAVAETIIPLEFTMLAPQPKNFEFLVPCHARCGGVKVYTPSACAYADYAS